MKLVEKAEDLSYADITKACEDAMKDAIILYREEVSSEDLLKPPSPQPLAVECQDIDNSFLCHHIANGVVKNLKEAACHKVNG